MAEKFVDPSPHSAEAPSDRQKWMSVLARTPVDRLKSAWKDLDDAQKPVVHPLRSPERGLVMVRGRAAGIGEQFNLGEMTVTRSAVRMEDGTVGISYLGGRDKDQALIAATVDAMMQSDEHRAIAADMIISPLEDELNADRRVAAQKTASTKVNFFTMVRTRDGK